METAALTYTVGICCGKSLTFKPFKVQSHKVVDRRLILRCEDGSLISASIDKYDYKLYPDYKAAKAVKERLKSQLRTEMTVEESDDEEDILDGAHIQ